MNEPASTAGRETVLEVRGLGVQYQTQQGEVHAVTDVSFDVYANEVFGIAGESGCGKSTLIKALLRLLSDNSTFAAEVARYRDRDLFAMSDEAFRRDILWQEISLVPQSAMNSFNPVYLVADPVNRVQRRHRVLGYQRQFGSAILLPLFFRKGEQILVPEYDAPVSIRNYARYVAYVVGAPLPFSPLSPSLWLGFGCSLVRSAWTLSSRAW